jgi:hypothetical protein
MNGVNSLLGPLRFTRWGAEFDSLMLRCGIVLNLLLLLHKTYLLYI